MNKLVAIVILTLTVVALVVPPAHAHGGAAASAALALGAFAAFNILFAPLWSVATWYPPAYAAPAPVYAAPAYRPAVVRYAASRAPLINREVVYPGGRYLLYGDGVRTPYQWVWVPAPPPPPAAPPAIQ